MDIIPLGWRRVLRPGRGRMGLICFSGLLVAMNPVNAQEPPDANKVPDDELNIRGVLETALPGTEQKYRLKLIVHPHFGDLHRLDYLRTPVGLRYGLTQRWEITGEVETYFAHGLGGVPFLRREGISNYHLFTKYRVRERFWPGWDTAVGLDFLAPTGNPPPETSDGLQHLSYFATFSRHLALRPDVRFFWGLSSDNVSQTKLPVTLDDNELGDDSLSINAGFVWQRPKVAYTFETTVATTRLVGDHDSRDVITFRPGVVWPLPKRYTFNSRGQWYLGLAPRVSVGPDGAVLAFSVKLRGTFDFKGWLKGKLRAKEVAP